MRKTLNDWELKLAGGLLIVLVLTRPDCVDNGIPYLVDRSLFACIFDFILLASVFGLSISAVRECNLPGRLLGVFCLLLASGLLLDWLHFLLNWRLRRWG